MNPTTTVQIDAAVNNYYDRRLLMIAKPALNYLMFAQQRNIPANSSGTIKFRRYSLLAPATTPLTEGVTPVGSQMAKTDVTASVSQYGDFLTLTDVLQYTVEDNALKEANSLLGQQAANTFDRLTRDVLAAGMTIQYASTATSRTEITAAMKITKNEIKEAVRTLKNANALKMTKIVDPSNAFNTTPLPACYIAFVHPDTVYDLQDIPGWIPVEQYGQKKAMENEVGTLGEVRFIESTEAKVFTAGGSGSIDVYATIIIAQEAYGVTSINGQTLQNVIKPLGSAGAADPLNQRATSGWKSTFVAVRLNEDFMLRIEHAVSA
jgi:N4-gp56 family major capsid protein